MVTVIVAIVAVAVVVLWLVLGLRFTGLVATNFGEDPRFWQIRMLPFGLFGPVLLWLLLSRRGSGRGGWA